MLYQYIGYISKPYRFFANKLKNRQLIYIYVTNGH